MTVKGEMLERITNSYALKTKRKMIPVVKTTRDEIYLTSSGCYKLVICINKEHYISELYWNGEIFLFCASN